VNLLRRDGRPPLVVGHRGAAALAPENTLASLAAGVDAGADLVEFDVGAGLVLAHSPGETPDEPVTLDGALAYLAGRGAGVHVDVKAAGIEAEIVAALRRYGLLERAVVSSAHARSVRRFADLEPAVARAISYPHDRHGVSGFRWPRRLTSGAAGCLRAAMPLRAPLLLRAARANGLSLHHAVVSPALVAAAHRRGVPVLAWTANDPGLVERLAADGVDGIVSDDPGMAASTLATLIRP
jgi:glycerophosphoryl diester phosphodiesterase